MTTSSMPSVPSPDPGDRRPDPGGLGGPRRLKAEDPDDLLAVLPYLLGYQPTESLVMAAIRDKVIEVCVRVDLDEDPGPVGERLAEIAAGNDASGVLLVAYGADAAQADRLLLPVLARLEPIGVIDAIYTDGQRRWSRICSADCCPPEGIAYRLEDNRLAAEAVFQGMTRHTDRAAIAELVQGPPPDRLAALSQLTEDLLQEVYASPQDVRSRQIREWVTDHVRRRLDGADQPPSDRELVRLACLILDIGVRDVAWALMRREDAWVHVELWQQVVARAIEPLELPALGLLGMAAWISGQGTLQVCCIDRARRIGRDYSLIDLLEEINERALPPSYWAAVRNGVEGAVEDGAGRDVTLTGAGPNRAERRRRARRSRKRNAGRRGGAALGSSTGPPID